MAGIASGKDRFLCLLLLGVVIGAALMFKDTHKDIQARQLQHPDKYPQYTDFWLAAGSCVGFFLAQLMFRSFFMPMARAMVPKKPRWSYVIWGFKVSRCCDYIFKCSYYSAMTVWGFALLRKQPWMPPVLGGSGATIHCWTDGFPFQEVSPEISRFYLTAVGYHLSEVSLLLLETKAPDFWEMLLHHTVSCVLVSSSYIFNYVRLGSLILFLHSLTDVPLYFSKAVIDTPFIRLIALSYFALVASYAICRCGIYPTYMMHSAWVESIREVGIEHIKGWGYMNFAMCVLFLLHMYWFGLILKIGLNFGRTGEARDLQSKLSQADLKHKAS